MKPCLMLEGKIKYNPSKEDNLVLIPFEYIKTYTGGIEVHPFQRPAKDINEIVLHVNYKLF